jgi:capsular polysaccharide biosynthesis protein
MLLPEEITKAEAVIRLAEHAGIPIGNAWQSETVGKDIEALAAALGVSNNGEVRFAPHREVPDLRETRLFSTPLRRFAAPGIANVRHSMFKHLPAVDYDVSTPDFSILTIPDGYVCNYLGAPVVVAADGETVIADYSSNYAGLLRFHPRHLRDCLAEAQQIDGTVVLIADDVQVANFFHWTIDWLPRLAFLGPHSRSRDVFAATAQIGADFQPESLRLCGIDRDRILPLGNFAAVRARELLVPSSIAQIAHPGFSAAPWVVTYLRATLGLGALQEVGSQGKTDGKVYVSRRDAAGRRVVNDAELVSRLRKAGYREIVLSTMPLAEQIAIFATASRVIGLHGAGLVHFAFTPPGARMLEILPASYAIPTPYILAAGMGGEYLSYVAEDVVLGPNPALDDVRIDVDDFEARCRDFFE